MPIYKVKGAKKDGLQKYKVRVNYISDEGLKQLTRIAYGIDAAKDLEAALLLEVRSSESNAPKKISFQLLFDEFVETKKYEVRETTVDKYYQNYKLYIGPVIGNVRIDKLGVSKLREWKLEVEKKGLALKTKQNAYGILREILNYAVTMEHLPKNPLIKVGNFKDAMYSKEEMNIYTAEEFLRFIKVAKQCAEEKERKFQNMSEWDYVVFFSIAFYTGLRKGEIHALKWSDLSDKHVTVSRSATQKLKGEDRETPPKNLSSIRTLQMPLPLIQILDEHKERQKGLGLFTEDYYICGGERSLRDTTIQNKNKHYAKLAGIKTITIHEFRHTHVSLLTNERINIQEIARRLGHAKIEMTWNTYSHLYPREEERAIDVLNEVA